MTLLTDTTPRIETRRFDPFVDGFLADPYPHYARWREKGPVNWGRAPDEQGEGCCYVFSHELARQALADERLCLEVSRVIPAEYLPPPAAQHAALVEMLGKWMIFRDPPDHTRLRRMIMPAFAQTAVQSLQRDIDRAAQRLIARIAEKERFDLVADLALPLPVIVIGTMLGLPERDIPFLRHCSQGLLVGLDLKREHDADTARTEGARAAVDFADYLRGHIDRRRRRGGDDLLAHLVAQADWQADDDAELIATCALLLFAGHETTVNLIGNGVEALLRFPDQLQRLREDLNLLPCAVEEFARYNSPSQITFRFVLEPFELGGRKMSPGEPVAIVIGSANRDPAVFDAPERLDITRRRNPHLSYGLGRHACPGANLARREAITAIRRLLETFPSLRRADDTPDWSPSIGLRGLRSLDILTEGAA